MKRWQYYTVSILSGLSLLLVFVTILLWQGNQSRQVKLLEQQETINRGSLSQQVGVNVLRDMGTVAARNRPMRDLLERHGFTLTAETNEPATNN